MLSDFSTTWDSINGTMEPEPFWKSLNSLNSLRKKFSEIFS